LAEFLSTGIETEKTPASALLILASRLVLQEALEAEQREAPTPEAGQQAAAQMIAHFRAEYVQAMQYFGEDLAASLAHLRVPPAHRKFVRATDLIERTFEEQRRRTKVIPRFFAQRSCLKLAYAALQRAAERWHRVRGTKLGDETGSPNWMTELEDRQLELLRQQLQPDPAPRRHPVGQFAA
jgi:hypothetical protein